MKRLAMAAVAAALVLASPAHARDKYVVQAVQVGTESVEYSKGKPFVWDDLAGGLMMITPMPFDHGSLSFRLIFTNETRAPIDFDLSSIRVQIDGADHPLIPYHVLEKQARNRAGWSGALTALSGGMRSASASMQQDEYSATTHTPSGSYRTTVTVPSATGRADARAIDRETQARLGDIQDGLDLRLTDLRDNIVQLTTVRPGAQFQGTFILEKRKFKKLPGVVRITVTLGDVAYNFGFQVVKPGTPMPQFAPRQPSQPPAEASIAADAPDARPTAPE